MATEAEALLDEIRRGSLVALEVYLLGGGSLNARIGAHGDTLLIKACADSSMLITSWLVERGADVNLPNWRSETPLMTACLNRRVDVAAFLIEHGADLMAKDDEGRAAVDHADGSTDLLALIRRHLRHDEVLSPSRRSSRSLSIVGSPAATPGSPIWLGHAPATPALSRAESAPAIASPPTSPQGVVSRHLTALWLGRGSPDAAPAVASPPPTLRSRPSTPAVASRSSPAPRSSPAARSPSFHSPSCHSEAVASPAVERSSSFRDRDSSFLTWADAPADEAPAVAKAIEEASDDSPTSITEAPPQPARRWPHVWTPLWLRHVNAEPEAAARTFEELDEDHVESVRRRLLHGGDEEAAAAYARDAAHARRMAEEADAAARAAAAARAEQIRAAEAAAEAAAAEAAAAAAARREAAEREIRREKLIDGARRARDPAALVSATVVGVPAYCELAGPPVRRRLLGANQPAEAEAVPVYCAAAASGAAPARVASAELGATGVGGGVAPPAYASRAALRVVNRRPEKMPKAPLSLGIEALGGLTVTVVRRGEPLPTSTSLAFSTPADAQSAAVIRVVQGERALAADNRHLGEFDLAGIAPAPRGTPVIDVTLDVDVEGTVTVSAQDAASGVRRYARFSSDISSAEAHAMDADATKHAVADVWARSAAEARNAAEGTIYLAERQLAARMGRDGVHDDAICRAIGALQDEVSESAANPEPCAADLAALHLKIVQLQRAMRDESPEASDGPEKIITYEEPNTAAATDAGSTDSSLSLAQARAPPGDEAEVYESYDYSCTESHSYDFRCCHSARAAAPGASRAALMRLGGAHIPT